MDTSKRIYLAARREFLRYGYHASKVNRIANNAGVLRCSVHYHYANKKGLYKKFLSELIIEFMNKHEEIHTFYYSRKADYLWFMLTELHNNRAMFINTLNAIDRQDWKSVFIELILKEHQYLTLVFRLTGQSILSMNTLLPDLPD
ncbi:MAG: TetR/AcrR family transcriptional regulator [Bacteroidales bacterium]|nr:TetR/AcrR family transcriptional regulator [Bacteroidales bacterium]